MAKNQKMTFSTEAFIQKAISMRKAQLAYLGTRSQAHDEARIAAEEEFDLAMKQRDEALKAVENFHKKEPMPVETEKPSN